MHHFHLIFDPVLPPATEFAGFRMVIVFNTPRIFIIEKFDHVETTLSLNWKIAAIASSLTESASGRYRNDYV